ncbi:unnamed protein product [Staurois parvus]|uniref:Uncharacterized protein n=1 Tax=Staurois parvus TaxID=386267 RepID=A0ABN9HRZ0_9NEOB|nr:unnamed protein product [Staurois parvus]
MGHQGSVQGSSGQCTGVIRAVYRGQQGTVQGSAGQSTGVSRAV